MDRSSKHFRPPRSGSWFREGSGKGRRALALWIVPFAALIAFRAVEGLQRDPSAVAESRYLGLLTAAVLAAVAALVSRRSSPAVLAWTALGASAAGWIAYHGPSRGAVVTLILASGLTAAVVGAVRRPPLAPSVTVPAAAGFQLLLRPDLLLPPLLDARTLVSLLVLPAVAGVALSVLGSAFGARRAALAGAAVVVLAPGFNVTATAGLAAVAAGAVLARRGTDGVDPAFQPWPGPAVLRGAAIAGLAALAFWNLPLGALLAITGLALWARGTAVYLLAIAGLAVTALGGLTTDAAAGWAATLERWAGALALLPASVLVFLDPSGASEGRSTALHRLVLGGLFMACAARMGTGADALAASVALVALAVPAHGAGAAIQRRYILLALFGTTLLASYPWTRTAPWNDLLELFGIGNGMLPAVFGFALLAAGVAASALLLDRFGHRFRSRTVATVATSVVALAAGAALLRSPEPAAILVDSFRAVRLSSDRPSWRKALPPGRVEAVVLDTHLVHGADLEPGTSVAIVRLRDREEAPIVAWQIYAGDDTAEWASARPDVANLPGFRAPPHWLARLAPGGSFFSRLFRTRLVPEEPLAAHSLTVQRAPRLPPEVRVVLSRVEIRR